VWIDALDQAVKPAFPKAVSSHRTPRKLPSGVLLLSFSKRSSESELLKATFVRPSSSIYG
jgi:hypothetical protein